MKAADLFCGAGGTSLGALQAGAEIRFALNHWDVAVKTHSANFPGTKHVNSRLDAVSPSECPDIDLLFASPECTHHSRARGGKPTSDQQRAGAWDVLKWVEHHRPSYLVIENVTEFENWGPVNRDTGKPLKKYQGQTFHAWVAAIRSLGYRMEWRILNAADFGAATSRERLFVIARKGTRSPQFPEPTHARKPGGELPGMSLQPWRCAAEIIDWSIELPSVFLRKKPLQDKTLARIEAGVKRYVGPFVTTLRGTHNVDNTVTGSDRPLGTITAGGRHHGVCLPLVASTHFGGRYAPHDAKPCPTIRCTNGALLAVPFIYGCGARDGQSPPKDLDQPLNTIVTKDAKCVAVPFLADVNHGLNGHQGGRTNSIDSSLGTITTTGGKAVVTPLVMSYYGNGNCQPVDDPLGTVTCKDRFAVIATALGLHDDSFVPRSAGERSLIDVMRELGVLDIGFRMLSNHELAAAQGFTADYVFHGNKSDVTRQIGNSVSPPVAKAITRVLMS